MELIEIEEKIKEFSKKYGFIENRNNSNIEYVKKINNGFIIKLFFDFELYSLVIKVIVKEGNDLVPFDVINTLNIDALKSFILGNISENILKQSINLTVIEMINCVVFNKSKYIINK